MDQWNKELSDLFSGYRNSVPDRDPSATFMPELWRKIELRRSLVVRLRNLTRVFVAAAAAICLVFGMLAVLPVSHRGEMNETYLDVLADAHPPDNLADIGIIHEATDPGNR
jgi:hypothetical protein